MTPAELRAAIPALDETIYLNTGASSPSPLPVVEATEEFFEYHEYRSPASEGMYPAAFRAYDETRAAVADFVGADADEIALTQSTTDAVNRVAGAFEWNEGDVVVRTDLEHSAGILPWDRLERRHGVEIRVVDTHEGHLDEDAYADAVAGADLVCFSAVDWLYGIRHPVADLTDVAHDAGAHVLVDAVQAPGQFPVDVHEWGADFVAAAGHKWLLGPWGAGFLYVDGDVVSELTPAAIGYRSVEDSNADPYAYHAGAKRFEVGTTSPAPYVGLGEALDVVESVGLDTIQRRVERLTDRLKDGLSAADLLTPVDYHTGLVSFTVDEPARTVERLAAEGVQIRALPRPNTVRASVHVFNTEADVDALLESL